MSEEKMSAIELFEIRMKCTNELYFKTRALEMEDEEIGCKKNKYRLYRHVLEFFDDYKKLSEQDMIDIHQYIIDELEKIK